MSTPAETTLTHIERGPTSLFFFPCVKHAKYDMSTRYQILCLALAVLLSLGMIPPIFAEWLVTYLRQIRVVVVVVVVVN